MYLHPPVQASTRDFRFLLAKPLSRQKYGRHTLVIDLGIYMLIILAQAEFSHRKLQAAHLHLLCFAPLPSNVSCRPRSSATSRSTSWSRTPWSALRRTWRSWGGKARGSTHPSTRSKRTRWVTETKPAPTLSSPAEHSVLLVWRFSSMAPALLPPMSVIRCVKVAKVAVRMWHSTAEKEVSRQRGFYVKMTMPCGTQIPARCFFFFLRVCFKWILCKGITSLLTHTVVCVQTPFTYNCPQIFTLTEEEMP